MSGGIAALIWAAVEPADKRVFDVDYSDVELLGKGVTRDEHWPAVGLAIHVANGALFGAAYAYSKPFIPGPPVVRGTIAGLAENFATWPLTHFVGRVHPEGQRIPQLWGSGPALAQATFRHALFGAVLGLLEERLNADPGAEPPAVPVNSNGHGSLESAVASTDA